MFDSLCKGGATTKICPCTIQICFSNLKIESFIIKNLIFSFIFAQNSDGTLGPPCLCYIKVGLKGIHFTE